MTILRNPVNRIISLHKFILRRPDHKLHKELVSKNIGLADFVSSGITPAASNHMTLILSNLRRKEFVLDPEAGYQRAIQNISHDFFHLGIVEFFDLSLLMLKQKLGWTRQPYYLSENVRKVKPKKTVRVDPEDENIIREHNQLDIKLYEYVLQNFQQEVEEGGAALLEQLEKFQEGNRKFVDMKKPQRKIKDSLSAIKKKVWK